MKAIKIFTNGAFETIDIHEERFKYNYQAMQNAIDCGMIDIVHAQELPEPYCLVVDDEALLKDKPTINLIASYLYGAKSHGQPLCGDVLIMKDKVTIEGIDTVGLTDADILDIHYILDDAYKTGEFQATFEKLKSILNIKEREE